MRVKKLYLETYTKEYSAEYQSQALIDLAKKFKNKNYKFKSYKKIDIYTSHHTHYVIGTGANDPQKMDPNASRETLDHSIMYIFAVALEDGDWHHVNLILKQELKEKVQLKFGNQLKHMKIKNGQKNIMIQIPKKNHLELK